MPKFSFEIEVLFLHEKRTPVQAVPGIRKGADQMEMEKLL